MITFCTTQRRLFLNIYCFVISAVNLWVEKTDIACHALYWPNMHYANIPHQTAVLHHQALSFWLANQSISPVINLFGLPIVYLHQQNKHTSMALSVISFLSIHTVTTKHPINKEDRSIHGFHILHFFCGKLWHFSNFCRF